MGNHLFRFLLPTVAPSLLLGEVERASTDREPAGVADRLDKRFIEYGGVGCLFSADHMNDGRGGGGFGRHGMCNLSTDCQAVTYSAGGMSFLLGDTGGISTSAL